MTEGNPALKETRFTTFYSYKGGVGRSLALANLAYILAWEGRKVLIIDMDMEAPGNTARICFTVLSAVVCIDRKA